MFTRIVHCDWSQRAQGRWMAEARRAPDGVWRATPPRPVPEDLPSFLDDLLASAEDGPVLAAFDHPLGVPERFGQRSGYGDFGALLEAVAGDGGADILGVAATPAEVGPSRPFYPARPGGARLRHLLDGHGVDRVDALIRACERAGPEGGTAGCMFWTLGAKQVGKAALFGWRAVIGPARRRGAHLWPFDGDLADLAGRGGLVLAESYPGDAYGQLGLSLRGLSKRNVVHRAGLAGPLMAWAAARPVSFDPDLEKAIRAGFPPPWGGDDGFDAAIGLFAALAVVQAERPAAPALSVAERRWEGWILGKVRPRSPAVLGRNCGSTPTGAR